MVSIHGNRAPHAGEARGFEVDRVDRPRGTINPPRSRAGKSGPSPQPRSASASGPGGR